MNTGGRSGSEDEALTAPTSHEARRVRAVRELNDLQDKQGAAGWNMTSSDCVFREGSGGARAILEGMSSTISDTRPRNAKQQLQNSARCAPKDSQRKQSGSGRKDSRRSSSESRQLARQRRRECRGRNGCSDVVTKELATHGARRNEGGSNGRRAREARRRTTC